MSNISVIIPTYNRAHLISRSINSALSQSYTDLEVIVIDDCSSDDTEQIISSIHDERIRYFRNTTNLGAAGSRNQGVSLANSPLIAFLDSDDSWHSHKLMRQMEYWKIHPEFDMIYCAYLLHRRDHTTCKVPYANTIGNLEGDLFPTLLLNNTIGTPTLLMKKEDFISLGGFDTQMQALEDWDMVLRFSQNHQIGYIDEILVDAFLQPEGVSSQSSAFYSNRCKMIATYKTSLLEKNLFDTAVIQILQHAQGNNVLEPVQKMLMSFLQQ